MASVGFALALVFIGGAAGKLVCGLIAERVGILRTVILTELATGALIAALVAAPLAWAMLLLIPVGVALNGTSSVLYGTVAEFVRDDRQSRSFGLFYTLGSAAGAVAPLVFGLLSDFAGVPMALLASPGSPSPRCPSPSCSIRISCVGRNSPRLSGSVLRRCDGSSGAIRCRSCALRLRPSSPSAPPATAANR